MAKTKLLGIPPKVSRMIVVARANQPGRRLLSVVEAYREGEPVSEGEVRLGIAEAHASFLESKPYVKDGRDIATEARDIER